MRTTVDVDPAVLGRAKKLAVSERRTLGSVVSDALIAYVGKRRETLKDPPFALLVRGNPRGRFPTADEILALDDEEDAARLRIPETKRRAAP